MNNLEDCQLFTNDSEGWEAALEAAVAANSGTPPSPNAASVERRLTLVERVLLERKIASISERPNPANHPASRAVAPTSDRHCLVRGSGPSASSPSQHPQALSSKPSQLPSIASALKRSAPWRCASADEKFLHAIKVAHARDGIFFSVNLSPRQQRLTVNSGDPVRALARKFQRVFQGLGLAVPPFALVVETSPSGRTHAHGVLIQGYLARKLLVEALMKFGGRIEGRAASRQVDQKPIYDARGAHGYMFADADHTRRLLQIERVSYLSDDLRRLTCVAWEGQG